MAMEKISFASAVRGVTVSAYFYPPEGETRAVVQIAHGMMDRMTRYTEMAKALNRAGVAVVGNDHVGHGETAADRDALGFFGPRGARELVVQDMHTLSELARQRFPGAPLILIGHSMGSFLARMYAERWGGELSGLVLLGTGGRIAVLPLGKLLASLLACLRGRRHRSKFLAMTAFAGYNSRFKSEHSHLAWLSRDVACREYYADDPLCRFLFTVSAYRELFGMTGEVNRRAWFRHFPPALPVLIASGDADPVGAYGKGVREVASRLCRHGAENVHLLLYPGARHELHHETNREEFFRDLTAFILEVSR